MRQGIRSVTWLALTAMALPAHAAEKHRSHPPLYVPPPPSKRPLDKGPHYFVDAKNGDDKNAGTEKAPWQSVRHALSEIGPGDTLCLRAGVYYESVAVRLQGTAEKPITIRAYPGERAIVDGCIRDFFESPTTAWEPVKNGAAHEYRSTKRHPNLRNVMGSFGDSMVGIQTYYHLKDLRATNELRVFEDPKRPRETDLKPLYCGPGVWYDKQTGYVHARLAHTHLPDVPNYRGETDPRKLPLLLAPFRSVPLSLDGVAHLRVLDLVVRGAGYDAVILNHCRDVELDNVTVWAGSYGLRLSRTVRFKMLHCGVHGNAAPWTYRSDTSLRSYPGRPHRDITRLNTHALLVPEAGREFSVYALPINDDWEIAHCDFTGGHDGIYVGAINLDFHHNRIYDTQDDGVYFSPMYPRYSPRRAEIRFHHNYVGKCLTALAFGGPERINKDRVWIYRNVIDLREKVATGRPAAADAPSGFSLGKVMGDHGSPPWSEMNIYHNTFVMHGRARFADMSTLNALNPERPRLLFNNVFWHDERLPGLRVPTPEHGQSDGNLYWQPGIEAARAKTWFDKYRKSPAFEESKKALPGGFTARTQLTSPQFMSATDYRLKKGSPAIDAGMTIPMDWPDPTRKHDSGKPDVGAFPLGAKAEKIGR